MSLASWCECCILAVCGHEHGRCGVDASGRCVASLQRGGAKLVTGAQLGGLSAPSRLALSPGFQIRRSHAAVRGVPKRMMHSPTVYPDASRHRQVTFLLLLPRVHNFSEDPCPAQVCGTFQRTFLRKVATKRVRVLQQFISGQRRPVPV